MGLFGKHRELEGDKSTPTRRDKKAARSVFNAKVLARVQFMLSTADGFIASLPPSESEDGTEGGRRSLARNYRKALINPAGPQRPRLVVVAVRRERDRTKFTIGIGTRRGVYSDSFTETVLLTPENAAASALTLAKTLFKDEYAIGMCTTTLKELAQAPEGTERVFRLDDTGKQLMIEMGEGR